MCVYVCVLILKEFNHGLPLLYILCGCRDGRGEFQTSFHGKIDGFPGSQEDDLQMIGFPCRTVLFPQGAIRSQ